MFVHIRNNLTHRNLKYQRGKMCIVGLQICTKPGCRRIYQVALERCMQALQFDPFMISTNIQEISVFEFNTPRGCHGLTIHPYPCSKGLCRGCHEDADGDNMTPYDLTDARGMFALTLHCGMWLLKCDSFYR